MSCKWIKGPNGEYIRGDQKPKKASTKRSKSKRKGIYPPKRHLSEIPGWPAIRETILERDGYCCRICGLDAVETQMNIHHIDWIREHNDASNLVSLCIRCHKQVHLEGYRPADYPDWPPPWGKV